MMTIQGDYQLAASSLLLVPVIRGPASVESFSMGARAVAAAGTTGCLSNEAPRVKKKSILS
jgi:hypothetical protein